VFACSTVLFMVMGLYDARRLCKALHDPAQFTVNVTLLSTIGLIVLSTALRTLWMMMRACGYDGQPEHFINRVAMYLQFSGLTCYLLTWTFRWIFYDTVEQTMERQLVLRRRAIAIFWVGNGLLWASMLTVSIVFYAAADGEECRGNYYNVSIFVVSAVSICTGLGFFVAGIRLWRTNAGTIRFFDVSFGDGSGHVSRGGLGVTWSRREETRLRLVRATRSVITVSLICFVMFCCRCGFWAYRPLYKILNQCSCDDPCQGEGAYTPKYTYPAFFYTLVELLPSLAILVALRPRSASRSELWKWMRTRCCTDGGQLPASSVELQQGRHGPRTRNLSEMEPELPENSSDVRSPRRHESSAMLRQPSANATLKRTMSDTV